MRHAAEQASHLVRLVQTFSRRDLLPPHPVSVNETLRTLHDLLQRLLGPSCRLSVIFSEAPLHIQGDEGALEQLLAELLGRTAHHHGLCLRVIGEDDAVEILCEGAGALVDTEGLSELISYLNGIISVGDSGWTLRFPSCKVDTGPLPEPPLSGAGLRVLLAEGDPKLRTHLKTALEQCGFAVTEAADVSQVRERLDAEAAFDAAALDAVLPGGGKDRLLACGDLPANSVWLLPFEGWGHAMDMSTLAKPFKLCDLHKALMIAAS